MPDQDPGRRDAPACASSVPVAGAPEELALDLSPEAVRLFARDGRGAWTELDAAPLAGGDFRAALEPLRRQAEALGGLPVTLWLPPDQVVVRRYILKRGDRPAEALRRMAEDTGHRADDLSLALSPAADGELVTVLGTFKQTIAEALAYARRWGFRADRVSTRVEAARFGAAGPAFGLPAPARRRAGAGARQVLAATAAILAIGLAGWGAHGLLPAPEPAPLAVASAPQAGREGSAVGTSEPGAAAAPRETPRIAQRPAPDGRPARPAQPAGAPAGETDAPRAAPRAPAGAPDGMAGETPEPAVAAAQGRTSRAGEASAADARPPEPAAATPDARLGRGSGAPERRGSGSRPQSAAPEAGAELGSLLAGIDRIRVEAGDGPARDAGAPDDAIVLAAGDAAPVTVPGRPLPRPGGPDAVETEAEPDPEAQAQPDAETDAGTEAVEAEGSDIPARAEGMSDSPLAAVLAPPPPARPARQWQASPAPGPVAAPARRLSPRLGSAAAQGGLALDATSLIGVIDANTGREALLRMPAGDFLKVSRGDQVAGWRVSAIGQDAMRLTRGGESRTLLLVTR